MYLYVSCTWALDYRIHVFIDTCTSVSTVHLYMYFKQCLVNNTKHYNFMTRIVHHAF